MAVKEQFDPSKPFKTVNGLEVVSVTLTSKEKIMGIVKYADEDAFFCSWGLDGKKINIFPRSNDDPPDYDLINLEVGAA